MLTCQFVAVTRAFRADGSRPSLIPWRLPCSHCQSARRSLACGQVLAGRLTCELPHGTEVSHRLAESSALRLIIVARSIEEFRLAPVSVRFVGSVLSYNSHPPANPTVILNPLFRVKDPRISSYPGAPRHAAQGYGAGAAWPRFLRTMQGVLRPEVRPQDDSLFIWAVKFCDRADRKENRVPRTQRWGVRSVRLSPALRTTTVAGDRCRAVARPLSSGPFTGGRAESKL